MSRCLLYAVLSGASSSLISPSHKEQNPEGDHTHTNKLAANAQSLIRVPHLVDTYKRMVVVQTMSGTTADPT